MAPPNKAPPTKAPQPAVPGNPALKYNGPSNDDNKTKTKPWTGLGTGIAEWFAKKSFLPFKSSSKETSQNGSYTIQCVCVSVENQ